ncbi:hypothetical protein HBB16_21860 [Pseudonocardia sp. MCCB 268]|nr:hypothetical protein [Pseudonocardia cytotoxica]
MITVVDASTFGDGTHLTTEDSLADRGCRPQRATSGTLADLLADQVEFAWSAGRQQDRSGPAAPPRPDREALLRAG